MRIYVASSWRNEHQQSVVAALRSAGHDVYDFRNPAPGDNGFSWKRIHNTPPPWTAKETIDVLNDPAAQSGFNLDFDAMKGSEVIIMVQPCGRSAALELGWGCGNGKRTAVLMADGQEPELMLKCADALFTSIEDIIDWLK